MVIGTELISEVKYIICTAHLGEDRMSSFFCLPSSCKRKSGCPQPCKQPFILKKKRFLPIFSKNDQK